VVIVEFAYSLPILMALAFSSVELTNLAIANMRVSQITMGVADNLSRAMQSVPMQDPQLREVDINDALLGADIQGGTAVPILTHGRIVLSNLHRNSSGNQTILWQRCKGVLTGAGSRYGVQGATQGTTAGFTGMGSPTVIQAPDGTDILFAEVTYNYRPLVGAWALGNFTIRRESAYLVRDNRERIAPINPSPTASVSACNVHNSTWT
jgi:hypothetical protein